MTSQDTPALDPALDPKIVRKNAFQAAHDTARRINLGGKREPGQPAYESLRVLLGQHFPHGTLARTLLDQWREGAIGITASVASYDKDGFFEGPGGCIRDNDPETEHERITLRIATSALPLPNELVPDPADHPDARRIAARALAANDPGEF